MTLALDKSALDTLEGLARDALDETWNSTVSGPDMGFGDVLVKVAEDTDWPVIAHHIHAFRPQTALALITLARASLSQEAECVRLRAHLRGMCDAYELLCQQSGMKYHESPSSKYAAARQAASTRGGA